MLICGIQKGLKMTKRRNPRLSSLSITPTQIAALSTVHRTIMVRWGDLTSPAGIPANGKRFGSGLRSHPFEW